MREPERRGKVHVCPRVLHHPAWVTPKCAAALFHGLEIGRVGAGVMEWLPRHEAAITEQVGEHDDFGLRPGPRPGSGPEAPGA